MNRDRGSIPWHDALWLWKRRNRGKRENEKANDGDEDDGGAIIRIGPIAKKNPMRKKNLLSGEIKASAAPDRRLSGIFSFYSGNQMAAALSAAVNNRFGNEGHFINGRENRTESRGGKKCSRRWRKRSEWF